MRFSPDVIKVPNAMFDSIKSELIKYPNVESLELKDNGYIIYVHYKEDEGSTLFGNQYVKLIGSIVGSKYYIVPKRIFNRDVYRSMYDVSKAWDEYRESHPEPNPRTSAYVEWYKKAESVIPPSHLLGFCFVIKKFEHC